MWLGRVLGLAYWAAEKDGMQESCTLRLEPELFLPSA